MPFLYSLLVIIKIGELVKLSGGSVDERLEDQFKDITRTILQNQNEALGNLTTKVSRLKIACLYFIISQDHKCNVICIRICNVNHKCNVSQIQRYLHISNVSHNI